MFTLLVHPKYNTFIYIVFFFHNPLQPIPLAYISLQVLNKVLNVMRVYKHSIFCASNSSPVLARERCQNTEKMFPAHPVASLMHSIVPFFRPTIPFSRCGTTAPSLWPISSLASWHASSIPLSQSASHLILHSRISWTLILSSFHLWHMFNFQPARWVGFPVLGSWCTRGQLGWSARSRRHWPGASPPRWCCTRIPHFPELGKKIYRSWTVDVAS